MGINLNITFISNIMSAFETTSAVTDSYGSEEIELGTQIDTNYVEDDNGEINLGPPSSDEESEEEKVVMTNAGRGTFRIFRPDGTESSFCEYKRYRWYLKKGLAVPYTSPEGLEGIKLTFEPKKPVDDEEYQTSSERTTMCHCCGTTINLQKFHVLPSQFKRHYPDEKKKHNITDILLVCKKCSGHANHCTDEFKKAICFKLGVKSSNFIDPVKNEIRILAQQLCKSTKKNMPTGKGREILERKYKICIEKIKKLLGKKEDLTCDNINTLRKLDCSMEYQGCTNLGEYIVKKFQEKDKLDYFTNKWKTNFIVNVWPNHVPSDFVESIMDANEPRLQEFLVEKGFRSEYPDWYERVEE